MSVLARASATVLFVGVVVGCEPVPATPEEWRFSAPEVVWQQADREMRSVFVVEAMGGRTFVFFTATAPDGQPAVHRAERLSDRWSAVEVLLRPLGATQERVEWATSAPVPAVYTLTTRPTGTFLAVRAFEARDWAEARAVTSPLLEDVATARVDLGVAFKDGRRRAHVVYAVRNTGCPDGFQLRHRASSNLTDWGASWTVIANPCAVQSLSLAASPSLNGPLMAFWTGSLQGAAQSPQDLLVATAPDAASPTFGAPSVIQSQGNRFVHAVATDNGRFMAAWVRALAPEPDALAQRAIFAAYEPVSGWTRSDVTWFNTSVPPFVTSAGPLGAYVFALESETVGARLAVRRWASPERPVASFSPIYRPVAPPSWLRMTPFRDGSLQAVWIESMRDNTGQRVLWSSGVRTGTVDAGAADARR